LRTRSKISPAALLLALGIAAPAAATPALHVAIEGLTPAGTLPESAAFCLPSYAHAKLRDRSPGIRWSAGPPGTRSFVLLMIDPDVTADLSLMNKPGFTIPVDAPRMNITHWLLVDIPPAVHEIPGGAEGDGFVPGGKPIGTTRYGVRGTNDYWPYFNRNPAAPPAMKGPYGGYDGPCPPGNDLLQHRYVFRVYALDVASLGLGGRFFTPDALKAMQGHILATGEAVAKFVPPPAPPGSTAAPSGLPGVPNGAAGPAAPRP
jgi:Raf kinase inhibitor-like YbhB/YbcL family protein